MELCDRSSLSLTSHLSLVFPTMLLGSYPGGKYIQGLNLFLSSPGCLQLEVPEFLIGVGTKERATSSLVSRGRQTAIPSLMEQIGFPSWRLLDPETELLVVQNSPSPYSLSPYPPIGHYGAVLKPLSSPAPKPRPVWGLTSFLHLHTDWDKLMFDIVYDTTLQMTLLSALSPMLFLFFSTLWIQLIQERTSFTITFLIKQAARSFIHWNWEWDGNHQIQSILFPCLPF